MAGSPGAQHSLRAVLLWALAAGCSFSPQLAAGKVSCENSGDCPAAVPICIAGGCYPVASDGGANPPQTTASGGSGGGLAPDGSGAGGASGGGGAGTGGERDAAADPPDGAPDTMVDVADGGGDAPADMAPDPVDWPVCAAGLPPSGDLGKGLVLYLHLDETGTNPVIADSSANHLTTNVNKLGAGALWTSGRFGGALALSGGASGGWINVAGGPTALNTISDGITLSVWVKLGAGVPPDGALLSRRAAGPRGYLYLFSISGGRLRGQLHTKNGSHADLLGNRDLPTDGRWMHLAISYGDRGQGVALFVNGEPFGTDPAFALQLGAENTALVSGAAEDAAALMPETTLISQARATIDELAVYNRTLTAGEVKAIACGAMPPSSAVTR